ncbi:GNAT family N-acetyltransferase [Marinibacterium profundimaris]|uniref:N-acetyltransferase domain-containing protein n=1 Tax=Marinibacterium profundimaris TaxID=1679460 RepID=A0A225NSK1_9RHOB|nr:GNAT family N-acetyltransferase [Marinibacterium profundimaris]OWU77815.1 hypothetical protein ATO3_03995 [Marinibacterium profundimaris]
MEKDPVFGFRRVTPADAPLLRGWLEAPRVSRWFDEPDYASVVMRQLDDPALRCWIVTLEGVALAYLQDYDIHAWQPHPLDFLPKGARGIDTFVGSETAMGRGLGPAYLRAHAARCFAEGAPALGIDPHPDNAPAIRAYEKAGFRETREVETDHGRALLMVRDRPE